MAFRFLMIIGILLFSAGVVQAEHRGREYDGDRDNRNEREKDYRFESEYGWGRDHIKHIKQGRKAFKKHEKKHKKLNKHIRKEHKKYHKHYAKHRHYQELPEWAHRCGLPPGLAKRHKIPRGWERRCRAGQKYYDHRDDFRRDVYSEQRVIYREQPSYQTVYEMDASECKVVALRSAGNIAEKAAIGAVFGAIIGAAGGAIIESTRRGGDAGRGAVSGAVGGAVGGAVLGGILASNEYKHDFSQCMRQRGHWRY